MSPVSPSPATEPRRTTHLRFKPPDHESDPDADAKLERGPSRGERQGKSAGNSGGTRGSAAKDQPKEAEHPVGVGVGVGVEVVEAPGLMEVDDSGTAINNCICAKQMQMGEEAEEQAEGGEGSVEMLRARNKRVPWPSKKRRADALKEAVGLEVVEAPGLMEVDDSGTAINNCICAKQMQMGEEAEEQAEGGEGESDDDDQEDTDLEDESPPPIHAPKLQHEFKREPQENNPAKQTATGLAICTPPASRPNQKRRSGGDDAKAFNGTVFKKPKKEPVCLLFYFHAEISRESDTSVDSVQGKKTSCSEFDLTQVFVNLFGICISLQKNLNLLSVKLLIEAACEKAGMNITDAYSTFGGKVLEPANPLSYYHIYKDSTVRVTHRVRGGGWPQSKEIKTWDDIIKGRTLHHTVNLPADLSSTTTKKSAADFMEDFLKYHSRLLVTGMCKKHFSGISYGGKFDPTQLLFKNGEFEFDDSILPEKYTRNSGELDYEKIALILHKAFHDEANKTYPLHLNHLLQFLWQPPPHVDLDSEEVIAFLTNHFALLSYAERIAISEILDGIIARLSKPIRRKLINCGVLKAFTWDDLILEVFEMKKVYYNDAQFDPLTGSLVHVPYGGNALSCLHFSNNYFKHAGRTAGSSAGEEHNWVATEVERPRSLHKNADGSDAIELQNLEKLMTVALRNRKYRKFLGSVRMESWSQQTLHAPVMMKTVTAPGLSMFAKILLDAILIEVDLPKATYYAYNTGQDDLLHASIELYSTEDTERSKLCQLQIMEKVSKDLLQQIEAKDNTVKELSKGWDSMLNTTSQVATDLQYLVNKNPSPGFTSD
ncbi:hypothetical protein ACQ4PT_032047 [Festuca glaucescens]